MFDGAGKELLSERLPEEGMFEVGFSSDADEVWCWPAAWFARGMAGAVWLPVDRPARTIYRVAINSGTAVALVLPDAVADCALSPADGRALVSCWDGRIHLLERAGRVAAALDAGGPARLAWSNDGAFAVAGTADGRLLRVEQSGKLAWSKAIPVTEPPPLTQPPCRSRGGFADFPGGPHPAG